MELGARREQIPPQRVKKAQSSARDDHARME